MSFFLKKKTTINYSFVMGRFSQKIGNHFQYFPIDTWQNELKIGIQKTELYLPLLNNKKIAIVSNHTSKFYFNNKSIHLVDSLLKLNVNIKKVFAPEHGFRGNSDAGEKVVNTIDSKTGLPIISLYGDKKKPLKNDF